MKKIGVVGVCIGGTSLFYPYFVRQAILQFDKKNPEVFIHQLPLDQVDDAFNQLTQQNSKVLSDLILGSINQLMHCNVDTIVIPNNAAHMVIDTIQTKSPVPVINLLDATSEYCMTHEFNKVLILGSRWVMEEGLFQKNLAKLGIKSIDIDASDKLMIHDAIMEAMVSGAIDQTTRKKIIALIERKKENFGCDAVIMACSDIIRALQNADVGVETVDTMTVLADKVLSSIE